MVSSVTKRARWRPLVVVLSSMAPTSLTMASPLREDDDDVSSAFDFAVERTDIQFLPNHDDRHENNGHSHLAGLRFA
jgi:hypothetical protein